MPLEIVHNELIECSEEYIFGSRSFKDVRASHEKDRPRLKKREIDTQQERIGTAFDLDVVANPPAIYRPAPFWSWNEVLDEEEVRRQVRELARGGLGGGFMHARIGLITPYRGEEFYAAIGAALEEARAFGMQMYLYDEDRWPSGWAGGVVPLRDANYRTKWLLRVPSGTDLPAGEHVSVIVVSDDGTRYCQFISPLGFPWFSGATYADLMNKEAMQVFIEEAYESYARRFGQDLGGLIPAIFTDEPSITVLPAYANVPSGMLFWTNELPERFRQQHGYDLLPHLEELFEDCGDFAATRTDYYRTCAWLFEQHYSAQIGSWCREHNIALTGHFMEEGNLPANLAWDVCTLPHYRHMDWPGIDHLGLQIQEVVTALGCRSVVNQYSKERMMSELFGCAGQHLSFEDRKWIAEQQIVLGVNFLVPHLLLYTMAGERKRDYPCNLWYQQPWWPLNHHVEDYLARLCALMAQGQMVPELLIVHPQESLYPLRRPPAPADGAWASFHHDDRERMEEIDHTFRQLSRELLAQQRSFDYGDETILADIGWVEHNAERVLLHVGPMTYPLVILPALKSLRGTTLALLEEFAEAGGNILSVGSLPTLIDGRTSEYPRLQYFLRLYVRDVSMDELAAVLQEIQPPQVLANVSGPREWFWQQTRRAGEQQITMLVNLSRHEHIDGTIQLNGITGPLIQVDLTQQTQRCLAQTTDAALPQEIHLEPGESLLLLAGLVESTAFALQHEEAVVPLHTYQPESWEVERLDENVLVLDYAAFTTSGDDWSSSVPVLALQHSLNDASYDGPLTLRYTFSNAFDGLSQQRIQIVLEHPERCTITINGQSVAYEGLPYWHDIRWLPVEIGAHVRHGENVLELTYLTFQHGDATSIDDQARRYGTEIEAIYLSGDFAVDVHPVAHIKSLAPLEPAPLWRLQAVEAPLINEPRPLQIGNLVEQGLPFYAGRVAYRTHITFPIVPQGCAWLECAELTVPVVEVRVNGMTAGAMTWRPYRVECSALLHEGENTIELVLYHSLRNVLGPHHNAEGETSWAGLPMLLVGPESFYPQQENWAQHLVAGEQVEGWRHSYAVTSFGLDGSARLMVEEAE